jgi:hypothetical protein
MKLPLLVLIAVSAAVISSCKKGDDPKPQQTPTENNNTQHNPEQPGYCPACGMG